jgi:hypothetical protein
MRVTRVDSLGRPVPGACSYVVTSGFVTVEMTAQILEGEEITVLTAGNEICVSERGCDQLQWLEITAEFCQVDPDLFSLINPNWTKILDCNGDTVGWEESYTQSCDAGFGLEIWSDVTGFVTADPQAEGAFVYYLLPWVVGGILGDLTIENAAVTFSFTGRTKSGSLWGRGPFNDVMCNPPDGSCGPLITPFSPNSPRRIFLTTCAPPPAFCGCQPLSSPLGPQSSVREDTSDITRMTVIASVIGAGPFTVDWGDGMPPEDLTPGVSGESHHYSTAGTYVIAIYPTGNPEQVSFHQVTLPFTGPVPENQLLAAVSEDTSDSDRMTALAEWDNTGFGTVDVNWGDTTSALAQPAVGTLSHAYAMAGTFTIMITDSDTPSRTRSFTIEIPFGPVLTITEDFTDVTTRRSIVAVVDNFGHAAVSIAWGDGTAVSTNPGDGSTQTLHTYAAAGTYTVTVVDSDEPSRSTTGMVTVPFLVVAPTITVTEDTGDVTSMTAQVTVDNHGAGPVNIDWGEVGSVDDTNAGDNVEIDSYQYTAPGTFTITVTDLNDPARTDTAMVTVPFP